MSKLEQIGTTISQDDVSIVARHRRRVLKARIYKVLISIALLLVLIPLVDMIYIFAYKGVQLISIQALTTNTIGSASFVSGGLSNAISGTLLLIAISAIIAVPLGVLGGVYMAEFAGNRRHGEIIRFFSDVLAGVPSIVIGYVGYILLVLYFGWGFSAMAGGLALSVIMLPYILRTTELSIKRVPTSIREAAIALGSSKTKMINRLTLRLALPGIITGILLSLSIAFGETAPLLYTANFSNYNPTQLFNQPVGYLTDVVYVYSTQLPSAAAHNLAYLAAFLSMLIIIAVNLVARIGLKRFSRI